MIQNARSVVAEAELAPTVPPWRRGWLYCAPGEWPVLAWIVVLHAALVVGALHASWPTIPILLGWLLLRPIGALGITVAYHRALSHRSVKLHPVVEQILIFFTMLLGAGTPVTWVANHRVHHAHSDTERDVHSPRIGGFWYGHLRWLWQAGQASPERMCPELLEERYQRWTRWQPLVLLLSLFGPLALGWNAWFWLAPFRLLYTLHPQLATNSFGHLGDPRVGGGVRNMAWLAPFHDFCGENWHRNHHERPSSARIGDKWWQIDTGWYLIRGLEWLGLAEVRKP